MPCAESFAVEAHPCCKLVTSCRGSAWFRNFVNCAGCARFAQPGSRAIALRSTCPARWPNEGRPPKRAREIGYAALQGLAGVQEAMRGAPSPGRSWARADLMEGDVIVRVSHSTINYKDGLAITGKAPVIRRWPMIPGIDFAGKVVSSSHAEFRAGDEVILNGWGARRDALRRLCADGARQGRLAGEEAGGVLGRRGDGDRHGRLHGHAVRAGAGAARREAGERAGAGDGSGGRRRQRRHRAAGQARLPGDRLDGAGERGGLSQGPRRHGDHRSRGAGGQAAAAQQGALGRRRRCGRQQHARQCAEHDQVRRHGRRLRAGAAAWTCPPRWRPSSCAA